MDEIEYQIIESKEFAKWAEKIRDGRLATIVSERLYRFSQADFGDIKSVGDGLLEARIHYGAGYRLYFIRKMNIAVIMLAAGDKSSQERDIKKAKKLANDWK